MSEERQMRERYDLTIERMQNIVNEETVAPVYRSYFQLTAKFILEIDGILNRILTKPIEKCTLAELQKENTNIYRDILGDNYETNH